MAGHAKALTVFTKIPPISAKKRKLEIAGKFGLHLCFIKQQKNKIMNKETILLIDDCEMMRRFLTPIFSEDYNVVAMKSATEAILWLKTNATPVAILLDYELPEMTGMDMLRHLRSNDEMSMLPVLMLSGIKDVERRWQCIEAGANDFLSKPFHPKELALRVKLMLKHSAQMAA